MKQSRRDFMKVSSLLALAPMAAGFGMSAFRGTAMASTSGAGSEAVKAGANEYFKKSPMASGRPFDYSMARRWAPNADLSDFASVFPQIPGGIAQDKLLKLAEEEMGQWMAKTQKSDEMQKRGMKHMPWGVFGCYQKDWETPHLLFAERCMGNKLWDVDGNEYIDLNFGDTPDMYGHGPENPAVKACAKRMLEDGISPMMGNEDQLVVAELLAENFGQPYWMHAMTASDANRYVLAIARHHTGRPNVAIPNCTYHGTIDETQKMMPEPGVIARWHDLGIYHGEVDQGTKIFNWNDLEGLEELLKDRTVAIVMMEPVMSNFGWAWPKPGWHEGVRALCKKYGTLLCYDETHTISGGPAGMIGELDLKGKSDFWTCGKAISSGIPGAVYGMSEAVAKKLQKDQGEIGFLTGAGLGFLGNALCGNTLSTLALRVTLEEVLTEKTFAKINKNVAYMKSEMERVNKKYKAPYRIETMGNRLCYHFIPEQAFEPLGGLIQVGFGGLFEFSHAYLWNRGFLLMPYFNMVIVAPQHTKADTDKFIAAWDDIVRITMNG